MRTGSIIDFYDDPAGTVLQQKVPGDLPDFIKQASALTDQQRDRLPDDVFALVMLDQGEPIRKYACVDKGNTALSVIYFIENHHKLPEEAQKTAAVNLLTACGWYDMQPPHQLQKLAGLGTMMNVAMGAGQMKGAVQKGAQRHNEMMGEPKVGELSGTSTMPKQSDRPEDEEKTASLRPHVDITGQQAPERLEKVASQRTLLNGQYPVDTYGEVEQARQWFEDYGESLHPADRREYCIKLAARAEELGVDLTNKIEKYAGVGYAPDGEIKVAVATRMQLWAEDSPERDMLKGLLEKRASVQPEVFCEALRQFDEVTGTQHYWDTGIYDPWYSTFGKTAGAGWTFEHAGDRVDEEMLKRLSIAGHKGLCKTFGKEVAEEFRKKPKEIFSSLPLDSKRIIMRMANDPQP